MFRFARPYSSEENVKRSFKVLDHGSRWIVPFPNVPEWNDFAVKMRRLTQDEITEINAKHGIRIGGKDGVPFQLSARATRDSVLRSIEEWRNAEDGNGQPLALTDENKLRLIEQRVIDEREQDPEKQRKSLFLILNELFDQAEDAERKN